MPKGRLRCIKPSKVKPLGLKVKDRIPSEFDRRSPESQERQKLYIGRDWYRVKGRMKRDAGGRPKCAKCRKPANTLDHLLGHDDTQAIGIGRRLGILFLAHWRDRFYKGPFLWLCTECHSTKTKAETNGRLDAWLIEAGISSQALS